eukprot:GEMP01024170.1.p1 GENE.GEMP01024170.1~~GEMP01024170.1.p1  ORF type:complete len:493 (+),score=109.93 GEMP01024170.1:141-1619(+)
MDIPFADTDESDSEEESAWNENAHQLTKKPLIDCGSSSSSESTTRGFVPRRDEYPWQATGHSFDNSPWRARAHLDDSPLSPRERRAPERHPPERHPSHLRVEAELREMRAHDDHRLEMADARWRQERRRMHEDILCMQRVITQLEETLEQKNAELADRPTHRDVKLLRNELERLQEPKRDETWKHQATRELIQRDKLLHRINTERNKQKHPPLDEVPRIEIHTFTSQILSSLNVVDLREAEKTVANLRSIVQKSLPEMKTFAEQVFSLTEAQDTDTAVKLVHEWADDRKEQQEWLQFHEDAKKILGDTRRAVDTPGEMIDEIRALKDFQTKVAAGKEAYSIVDKDMKGNPTELCYRLIRHFMQLFDVRDMEGVLPSMNVVFGRLNELRNFWKSLCVELGLDSTTSPITVVKRVSAVWRPLGVGQGTASHPESHRIANAAHSTASTTPHPARPESRRVYRRDKSAERREPRDYGGTPALDTGGLGGGYIYEPI